MCSTQTNALCEDTVTQTDFDLFIIGGGVNGCGIARDAAGRGYSVCLAEMNDLASGTSSRTTKLIHGGFRYLEHYEFRLVREALGEREVLLRTAPHVIWPLRFVLPYQKGIRPAWLLRLGLFLYDHIGNRRLLPGTKTLDLRTSFAGSPLKRLFSIGFEYSDCWANDARLVALVARDAADRGAVIETRTKCVAARRLDDHWQVTTQDADSGGTQIRTARLVINAAGPWVDDVITGAINGKPAKNVRHVKGSHIVVPKLFDHDHAYIFQNADRRIIFAIPYEQEFTLIGTTDLDYEGDLDSISIAPEETEYLCQAASEYFVAPIEQKDIVWTYSGVRPLYDDGASAAQEATRDYVLRIDGEGHQAALINIFGGKMTTHRKLAEAMMDKVQNLLGRKGPAWTAESVLPGGDFEVGEYDNLVAQMQTAFPFLHKLHVQRLVRAYGTRAWKIVGHARTVDDLGRNFGLSLFECEVAYLMDHEWAKSAEDVIWRRTKLGITMDRQQVSDLETWMQTRRAASSQAAE
jgi:glycerol-3-phosphate dehydrogenase